MSKQPPAPQTSGHVATVESSGACFVGHDDTVCPSCGWRAFAWPEKAPLLLPHSDRVRQQISALELKGELVTFLAIALGILDHYVTRLSQPEEVEELRFVRECLQHGREMTRLPAKSSTVINGDDAGHLAKVADEGYTDGGVMPVSPRRRKSSNVDLGKQRRGFLSFVEDCPEGSAAKLKACPWMGPAVPRWPVSDLHGQMEQQIRGLMSDTFDSWHFDVFSLNYMTEGRPLQFAGWEALCCSSCFSEFCIDPDRARGYLQAIEPFYRRDNQAIYHTNIHAADVTQTVHAFLEDVGVGIYFDPMDKLVTILSAAVHDLGHDGRTNSFHVNLQDQLALTYNDRSVLENYHLSTAFQLMVSTDRLNMLGDLSREQALIARREIIDCVLGTDMTLHFSRVADYEKRADEYGRDPEAWQSDARAMFALRGMLLHSSDISNQAKPFSIAHNWSMLLLKEFFQQGDEEIKLGLPVSPLCDRATDSSKSQTSFIEFVVKPTMRSLCTLLPKAEELCMDELEVNLKAWTIRRDLGLEKAIFNTNVKDAGLVRA